MKNRSKRQWRRLLRTGRLAGVGMVLGSALFIASGNASASATLGPTGMPPLAYPPIVLLPQLSPAAEYQAGRLYDRGQGVPQDFAAAAYWFCRSAQGGYAPAQLAIAHYYAVGRALPKDTIRAYIWANLAAAQLDQGSPEGQYAVRYREYLRFKLTVAELAVAQQIATGWPRMAAVGP